jgi:hypothetical protein
MVGPAMSNRNMDQIGRAKEPVPMPEHIKDAIAIAYGLLWNVPIDLTTERGMATFLAKRTLLQWITKGEQGRGIECAKTALREAMLKPGPEL